MADRPGWWLRPRVVFSALAAVVVLAVLTTPTTEAGAGHPFLTTYSYAPNGARGLHDLAARLGWPVERRLEPFRGALDSAATYAVLFPPVELTAGEVGSLLTAVRGGAGLIVIPLPGSPLADSLGLRQSPRSYTPVTTSTWPESDGEDDDASSDSAPGADSAIADSGLASLADSLLLAADSAMPGERAGLAAADGDSLTKAAADSGRAQADAVAPPDSADDVPESYFDEGIYDFRLHHILEVTRPLPADTAVLLSGHRVSDDVLRPIVLGRTLGRGRIVAMADGRILLNDTVRDSGMAELPIRILEWASGEGQRRIVFAEYHQGFGRHASMTRSLARGFVETPVGRAIGVLCLAGLLLLAAAGARAMPPRAAARIERRSPLEHMTALARAWEQVGASRTAVHHLVRGLRRRRLAGRRGVPDADVLRAVAARHPALAPDVDRVLAASGRTITPAELLAVGRAIATIERTITP